MHSIRLSIGKLQISTNTYKQSITYMCTVLQIPYLLHYCISTNTTLQNCLFDVLVLQESLNTGFLYALISIIRCILHLIYSF